MQLASYVFIFFVSWILGVAVKIFFPNGGMHAALFVFVLGLMMLGTVWQFRTIRIVTLCIMFGISLGMARLDLTFRYIQRTTSLQNLSMQGTATVTRIPQKTDQSQQIVVQWKDPAKNQKVEALVFVPQWEEYAPGEKLSVSCHLIIPKNKSKEFDWRMYLASQGIWYQCENAVIEKTDNPPCLSLIGLLFSLRQLLERNVLSVMPQPEAGLASGLLFGGSGGLSQEMRDVFSRTSMSHIVAVSGYNVTILAQCFMVLGILFGMWRQQAFWFAVLMIILFVVMIGSPASAIRAAVMGIVVLFAMRQGRLQSGLYVLAFAIAGMLLWNPLSLRYDVGFQLSALATLGIISFSPLWQKYKPNNFFISAIGEVLFMTMAAQIFVLPIILVTFQTFSLASPLINLLVLWTLPWAMLFSFVSSVISIVLTPLGLFVAFPAYMLLHYDIEIIQYVARVDWLFARVDNFHFFIGVGWYVILCLILCYIRYKDMRMAKLRCGQYQKHQIISV